MSHANSEDPDQPLYETMEINICMFMHSVDKVIKKVLERFIFKGITGVQFNFLYQGYTVFGRMGCLLTTNGFRRFYLNLTQKITKQSNLF